jgi:hypothetical protein
MSQNVLSDGYVLFTKILIKTQHLYVIQLQARFQNFCVELILTTISTEYLSTVSVTSETGHSRIVCQSGTRGAVSFVNWQKYVVSMITHIIALLLVLQW